ncbi:MAG: caspase family protein [Elusimicrobia bacterium]|nr:caspase family protein [Elusimicrobiota bacterium]
MRSRPSSRPLRAALAICLAASTAAQADDTLWYSGKALPVPDAGPAVAKGDADAPGGGSMWVVIVSVLEWKDASFSPFPKENRRDELLYKFFTKEKKVPADHILWLKDAEAALGAIKPRFASLIKKAGRGDALFFYYAGHGSRKEPGVTYFIPYDASSSDVPGTSWSVPDILGAIESGFKGEWAVLAADCCFSGGLCQEAQKSGNKVSYGCLASAQSSSPSTGEWTFTDSLLRGFTGSSRVDRDGDKQILFEELAAFIETEMAYGEQQLSASAATGKFTPAMKLADVSYSENAPSRKMVRWRDGKTYRATDSGACTASDGKPGRQVHYPGYKDAADECVAADSVGPYAPPSRQYADGSTVYASWNGTWYEAAVLGYKLGLHKIRYAGWSGYWDEWAAPDRLAASPPCSPTPCKP